MRKILITGGAGYIGSLLCQELLNKGNEVHIIDKFMFGLQSLQNYINNPNLFIHIEDINKTLKNENIFSNIEIVIHLAAIVGDPACAASAENAINTNVNATEYLVKLCKKYSVQQLLFASTCSVYGSTENNNLLNEKSELNPVSLYAETKIKAEQIILNANNNHLKTTILRFGTLFGLSNRPRFDLVINYLSAKLHDEGVATIFGGNQWRPFLHVKDCANIIIKLISEIKPNEIAHSTINIGFNELNTNFSDLYNILSNIFKDKKLSLNDNIIDNRSYNVDFSKLHSLIKVKPKYDLISGINELIDFLDNNPSKYKHKDYYNYRPNKD